MTEFKWPFRVYIEDTDAGGIVYYVNYLKFMERARTETLRHLGVGHADMISQGKMIVVQSVQINYRLPARLDDDLIATACLAELRKVRLSFAQQIIRPASGEILADAQVKLACVIKETLQPCAIPEHLIQVLQG